MKEKIKEIFNGDIYNWMIFILIFVTILNALQLDYNEGIIPFIIATITGGVLDTIIKSYKKKMFYLSKSGIISGMFVGVILTPNITMAFLGSVVAILSKHIIKYKGMHIFNPANFGILFIGLFGNGAGWWAANILWPVAIFGLFIVYRIKKFEMVLSFLIPYALLLLFVNKSFESLYLNIFNGILLFFVFLMLTEHKTSSYTRKGQIIYGLFTGVTASILLILYNSFNIGFISAFYLNIALFLGNLLAVKVK